MNPLTKLLILCMLAYTALAGGSSTQEKIARLSHVMRSEVHVQSPPRPSRRGRPGMAQILKSLPQKTKRDY